MDNINLYYEILGLNRGASLEEAERTYLDLLEVFSKYHISHDPQFRLSAQEKIREIKISYEEVKSYLLKHRHSTPSTEKLHPAPSINLSGLKPAASRL